MNHKYTRLLLRLLPWFWMAFIWSNSLQPASQSSVQSLSLLDLLDPLVQLLPESLLGSAHHILRKMAHAFEFAVLGTLWYTALSTFRHHPRPRGLYAAAISIGVAALDETIQLFVPGRSGQLSDVCLDSCGALAAILVCAGLCHLWHRHHATDRPGPRAK